jgi:hypothetical protein
MYNFLMLKLVLHKVTARVQTVGENIANTTYTWVYARKTGYTYI